MLKSLHHVSMGMMRQSLNEIHRVTKIQGMKYLSEHLFQGDLNKMVRIFHDDEEVRQSAFESIGAAVSSGLFSLE